MNYQETLEKLERLLDGYKKAFINKSGSVSIEDLCMLYGELEEVIHRFAGTDTISVMTAMPTKYSITLLQQYSQAGHPTSMKVTHNY